MFIGVLDGITILTPKNLGENKLEISGTRCSPEITSELIAKADFFCKRSNEIYF